MASKLYTVDPTSGKVSLNLHSGQSRAWVSKARYVIVIAGTQGGKTSFGPWWLEREVNLCGRGDYLAVSSSYDLFKLKMLPEIREVFEHILKIGRYWSGDKIIELADPATGRFMAQRVDDPMWGRIILRSASAEGGLESATAKAAWLDEMGQDDFPVSAWQAIERRISLNRGRVLGTTTPYNLGWMKQLLYDPWVKGNKSIDVISFASTLNPSFSKEEFEEQREKLPEWKFKMFYMGQFTKPAGLIYQDFRDWDRDAPPPGQLPGHKVKRFKIPAHWERIVGIDPGGVNTAKTWLAHDPDLNVYYLYRSALTGNKSTPEHAEECREVVRQESGDVMTVSGAVRMIPRVRGYYVGAKSETQVRLDYASAGLHPIFEPPVADVEAGIDRVIALFKTNRLFVFDDLLDMLGELLTYSRVTDTMGNVQEEIKDKAKFHLLDSLRYAAAGASRPRGVGFA
jgi:hypothetical protein